MEFADRDAAMVWIINNQLGKRNLHVLDKEALKSKKREIESWQANKRQGYRTDLHHDFKEKFPEGGRQVRDIIGKEIGGSLTIYRNSTGCSFAEKLAEHIHNRCGIWPEAVADQFWK